MLLQQRNTLRVRFALWTGALLLVALLGFSAFIYLRLGSSLAAALDDSLRLSAAQAAAAVNVENGRLTTSDGLPGSSAIAALTERELTLRILDAKGRVLQAVGTYAAFPQDTATLAAARRGDGQFSTQPSGHDGIALRVYTAPITEKGRVIGIVQVGQSFDSINDTLEQLVEVLLIGIPLIVVIAALGGYGLAARALQPIDHIMRTAQRISAEDLHARLDLPPSNDEVGRLATTFDTMLARLDTSFERERRFTADASHELRTPLAAMQAILGVTRERRRTAEEYEQALDDLGAEAQRLRELVENLLRLARGGESTSMQIESIDLSLLLEDVAETLAPLAEAKGLVVNTTIASNLTVAGDSDGLIRLWLNLLDNAIKYTEHGGITIIANAAAHGLHVSVRDTGSGIAAEHLPHLFDRFYRVDRARSSGSSGLGLALAHDIVQAHHGEIKIQSHVGVGTTVSVWLPCTQACIVTG